VFLTVDTDEVDTTTNRPVGQKALAITEVTGMYTGVQNSEIEIEYTSPLEEAQVYIVYNSDNYIVGAVIDGEGDGGTGTIAYVTSGPKSERLENGNYYWEFDAILNGTVQTLTVKDTSRASLNTLRAESDDTHEAIGDFLARSGGAITPNTGNWNARDGLVELRFDADEYVTSIRSVEEKDIYSYFGDKNAAAGPGGNAFGGATSLVSGNGLNDYSATSYLSTDSISTSDAKAYRVGGVNAYMVGASKTWKMDASTNNHYDSAPNQLKLVGRTLYTTNDQHDEGLALASDAKAVLIQWENGDWETTEYSTVKGAVNNVAMNPSTGEFEGEIVAALNSNGTAAWVVITSYNEVRRGTQTPGGRLTGIDARTNATWGWDNTTGYITYELTNAVNGTSYTVVLEQLNENGQWAEIDRWTQVSSGAPNVYTSPWVGQYTVNRTYRLSCEGFTSMVAQK